MKTNGNNPATTMLLQHKSVVNRKTYVLNWGISWPSAIKIPSIWFSKSHYWYRQFDFQNFHILNKKHPQLKPFVNFPSSITTDYLSLKTSFIKEFPSESVHKYVCDGN